MARKFLLFVAFCIVLVVAAGLAWRYWSREFAEIAFVPDGKFEAQAPLAGNAYDDPKMWFARPGAGKGDATFLPEGFVSPAGESNADELDAAVFFIHPTSYL